MKNFSQLDEKFMSNAIEIAHQHVGKTAENPSVGAVIVQHFNGDYKIVGRGITALGGRPHAEPQAIQQAGNLSRNATLYVTLEPCCHYGKTPPCTKAIIGAGIKRVVIAVKDNDKRVNGGGIEELKKAGIIVDVGCLTYQALPDLAPYLCNKKFGRPFITAKLAISADGAIGRKGEGQVAITGLEVQKYVHKLRSQHDAILIGSETALKDNPRLDCRLLGDTNTKLPVRIVFDSQLRLSLESNLVKTALVQPLWLVCTKNAPAEKFIALKKAGCHIIECQNIDENGYIDTNEALYKLAKLEIKSIFLEGGAKLMSSFWRSELIDQLILFQNSHEIGANRYMMPNLTNKKDYQYFGYEKIGEDIKQTWFHLYGRNGLL